MVHFCSEPTLLPSTGISNDLIIITARRTSSTNGSAKPVPPFGGGITEAVILYSHSGLVSDVSVKSGTTG